MRALSHSDVATVFDRMCMDYRVATHGRYVEPSYVVGVRLERDQSWTLKSVG